MIDIALVLQGTLAGKKRQIPHVKFGPIEETSWDGAAKITCRPGNECT